MKLENYLISEKKWNDKDGIVAELEKPGRVDWGKVDDLLSKDCGHCKEDKLKIEALQNYTECSDCTLFKKKICYTNGFQCNEYDYWVFYDIVVLYAPHNKRKALRIAKRIYKAILKDDPRR